MQYFVNVVNKEDIPVNIYQSENETGYYSTIMNTIQSLIASKVDFEVMISNEDNSTITFIKR